MNAKIDNQTCPVCGKNSVTQYAPFCSGRCADLDLKQWLDGGYVIAGSSDDSVSPEASSQDVDRNLDQDDS